MSVSLMKKQGIVLDKGVKRVRIGLGWDQPKVDADVEAFATDSLDKVTRDEDFVFYGNPLHPSGAIKHGGDCKDGSRKEGDDETIDVDFTKLPEDIYNVNVTISIHNAEKRKQHFGLMKNAYCRIMDADTNEELGRYNLSADYNTETAGVIATIEKINDDQNIWKFHAVGEPADDLVALCEKYGVNLE